MASNMQSGIEVKVRVKHFGHWLAVKRTELDLRQADIANAIGVTYQTISGWEKGEKQARLNSDQLNRLSRLFNCKVEEIPSEGVKLRVLPELEN